MRKLERFNIDIAANSALGELRSLKLNDGEYTRMQVINRKNNNLAVPVEIEIIANGQAVVESVDLRALEAAGGDFYESKAPVYLKGGQNVDIYLKGAGALPEEGSYQVIFWKKC